MLDPPAITEGTMIDKRRSPWIAWDSGFYASSLGDGLAERFGSAGIVLWNAYLCTCKRALVPGQIAVYNDHDTLSQLGVPWLNLVNEDGEPFTLDTFWTYLGRMKHVSRTRRGRATYVTCTHWEAWQHDARRDVEATRKRRSRQETTGTMQAETRTQRETFTETDTDTFTETDTPAATTPPRDLAVVTEIRILPTEFDAFWQRWPTHARQAEAEARKAWKAARGRGVTDIEMLEGVARWTAFWEQNETDPKFIPHPGNWLTKRRWLDAPPVSKPKLSRGQKRSAELVEAYREFTTEESR